MSSLLRSCKFVRFLAGISRNISYGNGRQDGHDLGVKHNPTLYRGLAIRALATQQGINVRQESALDRSLQRLDYDARRTGRISKKELDEILKEIQATKSATSSQSLMVLRCCGSLVSDEQPEVRTKLVQEIWNTLESLGVPMDISHFNALLRVYLENGHEFSPSEFLSKLEKKGIEPNRVTYQMLLAQHCQMGDMDGAAEVLQIMRDKQMAINETVFNSLLTGHAQNGDMESARGIIGVMKQAGLEPSPDTYTALMCGYAKQGDIEAIRAVIADCEAQNIELLDRDFSEIIFAMAKAGHTEPISELLGGLKKGPGFTREMMNLIMRLVNVGQEDIGRKILDLLPVNVRQAPDGPETAPSGTFFIRQLVKAGRPVEKIIAICDEMKESGLNPKSHLLALETALQQGNVPVSVGLMQKLQQSGQEIRQHFFWPLLAAARNKNDEEAMRQVITEMVKLGVPMHGETLRIYVMDALKGSVQDKLNTLLACGISKGSANVAIVITLLESGKLQEAAKHAESSVGNFPVDVMRRVITKAFLVNNHVDSLVTLFHRVAMSNDESEQAKSSDEVVSKLLVYIVRSNLKNKSETVGKVLQGLVNRGLSITTNAAETIQEHLGADLTPEISNLLNTLSSGSLEPAPLALKDSGSIANNLSTANLEVLYESLKARGQPTKLVRKNLLMKYCLDQNLEKAMEIKQSLDAEDFVYTAGLKVMLLDLYARSNKLDEALEIKKELLERDPDFKISVGKLALMASLLNKAGRFDDAISTLKEGENRALEEQESRETFRSTVNCWNFLNELADEKNEEKLQKVLDTIIEHKILPVNNTLFGPLIRLKLENNDMEGALEKFKWCCEQHRCTPWKKELTHKLIQAEDAVSLQKLTDLSTQVHGEINSLYDLAFAFVKCGRIKQARKILETPGLRARTYRMDNICERYREDGDAAGLEGILEATKDLPNIDRANVFLQLVKLYCKNKDSDKALGLWTRAQEENVHCSDEFLQVLGKHLKQQNMQVPFVMPEPQKPQRAQATPSQQPAQKKAEVKTEAKPKSPVVRDAELQELKSALRNNDWDKSLQIKESWSAKNRPLAIRDSSQLIEGLINTGRISEAFKLTKEMLEINTQPITKVLIYMLNKLAATGDVDSVAEVGKHLDEEKMKWVGYDNKLCNAYLNADRATEYVQKLEDSVKNAKTDDEMTLAALKFPKGAILGILEKHPELTEQIYAITKILGDKGHVGAYNVMWQHFFVVGKHDEANKLWKEHLSSSDRLMFRYISSQAWKLKDPVLCSNLLGLVITSDKVTPGAKGNIVSCLIDILVANEQFDDAVASLQAANKDVGLEFVNKTALERLKSGLESRGKTFPYTIPTKGPRPATTTSSSDDD